MDLYYNIILHSDIAVIRQLAMTNKALYHLLSTKYVWINKFKYENLNIRQCQFKPFHWINEYYLVKNSIVKTNQILKKTNKSLHNIQNGVIVICRQEQLSMINLITPLNLDDITDCFIYFMINLTITPYIQIYLFSKGLMMNDVILIYHYYDMISIIETILYTFPKIEITNIIGHRLN